MVEVYLHYYLRYNYMFQLLTLAIFRFYNYFLRIHVQPEDGQCQEPKHVVVPYVVM